MPKSTFFKLAESKRKAFTHEAYKEFSLHSFEAASITNLVKSLGIAKGSVYQYFEDKNDLYHYLITDANRQMNQLLDKACVYNGEDFFDWYTKLLMVELKFLLSFPQFSLLFQKLKAESSIALKALWQQIEEARLNRITAHLPVALYHSPINNMQLASSAMLIFEMLSKGIDLNKLIEGNDPIYLESKELVAICSSWVEKLKHGL